MHPMSAVKGRRARNTSGVAEPVVLLQGRVPPEIHAQARDAADQLGISIANYLTQLVAADTAHHFVRPEGPFVQEPLIARSA